MSPGRIDAPANWFLGSIGTRRCAVSGKSVLAGAREPRYWVFSVLGFWLRLECAQQYSAHSGENASRIWVAGKFGLRQRWLAGCGKGNFAQEGGARHGVGRVGKVTYQKQCDHFFRLVAQSKPHVGLAPADEGTVFGLRWTVA